MHFPVIRWFKLPRILPLWLGWGLSFTLSLIFAQPEIDHRWWVLQGIIVLLILIASTVLWNLDCLPAKLQRRRTAAGMRAIQATQVRR